MKKVTLADWFMLIGFLGCVALLIGGFVLQPLFEARAYNKFTTGPKATYWDALWTNLRVTSK